MRDFKGMKRQRGRNRNTGGKPQQHNANRAYDSNGPEGIKVRGAAQSVFEKYQQLARDATTGGDRVLAENYLQHAEHYFRLLRAIQPNRPVSDIVGRDHYSNGLDIDFEAEHEEPPEGAVPETYNNQNDGNDGEERPRFDNNNNNRQNQNRDDRPRFDNNGNRQYDNNRQNQNSNQNSNGGQNQGQNRDDRPRDRWRDRDDRPRDQQQARDDRPRDDRPREERQQRDDRPREDRPRDRDDRQQRNDGPRNEAPRNDAPRVEAPRDEAPREPREERPREEREGRRSRYDRDRNKDRGEARDPLAVIEPQAVPLAPEAPAESSPRLRGQDGAVSELPGFLSRGAEPREEAAPEAPAKPKRRRAPKTFEGGDTAPKAEEV
jgi:hypothetical protein